MKSYINSVSLVAFKVSTAFLLVTSLQAHQSIASKVDKHYELKFWAHTGFAPYKKEQFLSAKAYDLQGKEIKTGVDYSFDQPHILTGSSPALIVTNFDAGYWSQTDKGYISKPAYETNTIVFDTLRSIKIGKTYFSFSDQLLQPIGLKLEVTPLTNPLEIKVGQKLPVLVTYNGKPLANSKFENQTDDLEEITNQYGIAFIPVKTKGLNIIAARYQEPLLDDPQASKLLLQSSISFELK